MFIDGSPHAVTDLWDVGAHHFNLRFTCRRCGHWRVFHAAAVWWRFKCKGWSGHLSQVPRHFVCSVCWRAHRLKVRGPDMKLVKEDHEPLPLPSEKEWRQEAKRRR